MEEITKLQKQTKFITWKLVM